MSNREQLDVGFTEVLYGVVVANAIYELTFALELRNALLLLALAFIVADWVEYQTSINDVPGSSWRYAKTLVMDVVILVDWYFLTLVPVGEAEWFFAVAAVFFLLQYLWDLLILGETRSRFHLNGEVHLVVTYTALGTAAVLALVPTVWLILAGGIAFLARKTPIWRNYLDETATTPSG